MVVLHHDEGSIVTLEDNGLVKKVVLGKKSSGLRWGISPEELVNREIKALELIVDVDGAQKLVERVSATSFTSQYIEGKSLRDHCEILPRSYFDELVDIMEKCHERGVHRLGLTRADFLVTPKKRPAVVDFGNIILIDDPIARIPGVLELAEVYNFLKAYELRRKYTTQHEVALARTR